MKALRHFIQSAFTVAELKIFLADHYPAISPGINWQASAATVVFDVVTALGRHGVIDGHLLDALARERPSRKDDIDALFALLGPPELVAPLARRPQDDPKQWDIFLAHGSPDKPRVRILYQVLQTLAPHLRVFFDEVSIRPGQVWSRVIGEALKSSRLAVVVLSSRIKKSWYLETEVQEMIALTRKEKLVIVPLFLDGFDGAHVPYGLAQLHGLDAKALGDEEAMRRVVQLLA